MKKLKHAKRLLSLMLAITMVVTALPSTSITSLASPVSETLEAQPEPTTSGNGEDQTQDNDKKSDSTVSDESTPTAPEGETKTPTGDESNKDESNTVDDQGQGSSDVKNPDTENKDSDSTDPAEEKKPDGTAEEEKPGETTEEEIPAEEVTEEEPEEEIDNSMYEGVEVSIEDLPSTPYWNYYFGDPAYNENYYVQNEKGKILPEYYCDDIEEILSMVEEGMDLQNFFRGTIFAGFTEEVLQQMLDEGYTLNYAAHLYIYDRDMPDWLGEAFAAGADEDADIAPMDLDDREAPSGPTSLTGSGVTRMSISELGRIDSLGKTMSHGYVLRLRARGNDGQTYGAFCASYGGSYRTGYSYSPVSYSDLGMTNYQYNLLRTVINTYYKATGQQDTDFTAAQIIIWYIINNMPNDSHYFDPDYAWEHGGMKEAAGKIAGPLYVEFIRRTILSYSNYINQWWDAGHDDSALESVHFTPDNYPGVLANIHFWRCGTANSQFIITWDIGDMPSTTYDRVEIPYIDNYYLEKEATAKYHVELTKESLITNELLDNVQFEVVESEASGHDLDYDIYKGTLSSYGTDYPDSTITTFGQSTTENDHVPYMDADVEPSGGAHRTVITTDKNGYASTTFKHSHTFREFYSECKNGSNALIDYATYQDMWEQALNTAKNAEETEEGAMIEVLYKGSMVEMTYDEIKAIKDSQTTVYTQPQADAQDTIDTMYSEYMDRTYTYTVTELDPYNRPASSDSNGKDLSEINLPKEGYRKDVADTTTIGSYVKVLENGQTMVAGGTNDQDPNSTERNVTNEPWQNQIFINKTDLESNNQILYDTAFDVYEYYQYKVTLEAAEKKIRIEDLLMQFEQEQNGGVALDYDTIESATLKVLDHNGTEALNQPLDTAAIKAIKTGTPYEVGFTPTAAEEYTIRLELKLSQSLSTNNLQTEKFTGKLEDITDPGVTTGFAKTYKLLKRVRKTLNITENGENNWNVEGGGTVTMTSAITSSGSGTSQIEGPLTYKYVDADGVEHILNSADDQAGIDADIHVAEGTVSYTFSYTVYEDSGYRFYTDDDTTYTAKTTAGTPVSYTETDGVYEVSSHVGTYPADGDYTVERPYAVSANDLTNRTVDTNVATDINDYTTWGMDNYEIVRVTPEIAQLMGWSDTTIGMYTVHRLHATDAYCGTTFTSATDHATGEKFGYQEYGTLYYTQSNLGHFAIVEKTAPADGDKKGYLGNYSDRDDSKLTAESSQKNPDGAPYATDDNLSVVKMVHYLHLCKDTNQYATYMLVDGYKNYDAEKYTNYVANLDNEEQTPTEDGYDAAGWYEQSGMRPSISLEKYTLDEQDTTKQKRDSLNEWVDNLLNMDLRDRSGILTLNRNSQKQDTYYALKLAMDYQLNYVGTTINNDSFNDGLSAESDITFNGTYTKTKLNYNSYAADQAEALNARHGFNDTEFLQVGVPTYDNAAAEKNNRYYQTEADVNKEQGYSFIDERTYGYIRFTKYDSDAERYVDGDIDAAYPDGTHHGDADLDGAIYSLYVSETNNFTVHYYEGTLNGTLVWAQPLKGGGYRVIEDKDADASNGFTDAGDNTFTDYPHGYIRDNKLFLDYTDPACNSFDVAAKEQTYKGIQHPDGMYGGAKHNGWFAVLTEQQVFVDDDQNCYGDTWTLQDVTLENGAKVASATIENGEFEIDGLYLGDYYLAEEIRDAIVIHSTSNDDRETSEVRWLSFAPGYTAATDEHGNPTHYNYSFPYEGQVRNGDTYQAEQVYLQKDTEQVSNQQVVKGAGFQIKKETMKNESAGSGNTEYEDLEGAGFTVYLISELSLIKDGTIQPAFTEKDGNALVKDNKLIALYDTTGNMVGYQFTTQYIDENHPFEAKYGSDYDIRTANRIVYVKGRGYYYLNDILAAYKDSYYSNETKKWDFSAEAAAIARTYEDNATTIAEINHDYAYQNNNLNNGSPCEWYGPNGISDGWVATGVRNEYRLSEIFTNHYGNLRSPELPWGAYLVVETTTPKDVFTVDPMFVTVTDSSASSNRSRSVTLTDHPFKASLVMVKRDADSGQDVIQAGISYRIWDYQKERYARQFLYGPDGKLTSIAQDVFVTNEKGRLDAVANLEKGKYRIEEINGPKGFYNLYWDQGNEHEDEEHGGLGEDASRPTRDNLFKSYYGTVDFEVTTDRRYKSSGITSNGNLDYIYIGETYFNKEAVGKVNILKTGEVLVGYANTDDIEYADEYTDKSDAAYNALKASAKDRSVFENIKAHYDLGTDEVTYRDVTEDIKVDGIQKVDYLATDRNGMHLAAIYTGTDGKLYTMNGGTVYDYGVYQTVDGEKVFYPGVTAVSQVSGKYVYTDGSGNATIYTEDTSTGTAVYKDENGNILTDAAVIAALEPYCSITDLNGNEVFGAESSFTTFDSTDKILNMVYDLRIDTYEEATLAAAANMSIYHVSGTKIMNTDYLVTDNGGVLTTEDGGVLTLKSGDTYTITWTEAIYDPDINYDYRVEYADGTTLDVKYVTYGVYMTSDGTIVKRLATGGYETTRPDGTVSTDAAASLIRVGTDTGETWDFVYEERPLAGATYEITAAEDIHTQDGNGGTWFKKGDVVATVTTGNDGEIVSFAPVYKTGASAGSGSYDYTYYYDAEDGKSESLTDKKYYGGEQFATSGSIANKWIDNGADGMSQLDKELYGVPAFNNSTIYPNTFYNEQTIRVLRRVNRGTGSAAGTATDYVTRLEDEGGISTHSSGVVTKLDNGFRMTYTSVNDYAGANLEEQSEAGYYLLKLADGNTIEVKKDKNTYRVVSSASAPWAAGDIVTRTAAGYRVEHTDAYETGVDQGAGVGGAKDLGYTHVKTYADASLVENADGTYTLYDNAGAEILTMEGNILMTEAGAFVEKILGGYRVTTVKSEDYTDDKWVTPELSVHNAVLTVKDETFNLLWDNMAGEFITTKRNKVTLADDGSQVSVDMNGRTVTYQSFDLVINYDLHYANQSQIVRVENDGTLGEVSIYLPLGKYNIQEIATPYGFLINDQVQTVNLEYADQTKGVVFNTDEASTDWTDKTMQIWDSKGLSWFIGGLNTIGEKLNSMFNTNFFTWLTYFHAEKPYYSDKEGFVSFYDLRVKAWSREDTPTPDNRKAVISKQDLTNFQELPGAKLEIRNAAGDLVEEWTSTNAPHIVTGLADGTYTLTETTAPNGYEVAESITFTVTDGKVDGGTVVMYDAPTEKGFDISKKDITSGDELPGAKLILTNESGDAVKSWTSKTTPEHIGELPDGTYTLTEITAPGGYDKAESITFEVVKGVVKGGTVTMYDAPDENKTYISKQDITTSKELPGAKLTVTDASGKLIDRWTSSNVAHVIDGLADGTYTLTETTAPTGYERAESITFHVVNGKAVGGIVTMYDKPRDDQGGPEGDRREETEENQWKLGVGIYKADKDSNASLGGAKFGLYTKNDIYNVDGKLLAKAGTKLAVATTDDTGHANFAVDIALMSKYLDPARKDADLIHKKTITYTYLSLTDGPEPDTYYLEAYGADTILLTKVGSDYVTDDGRHLTIDTAAKTVTYTVEQSIDGNTAINSGKYYIQEITPPKGYLIDDTIYDVKFEYDDDKTMYIPVYAKHSNEQTEVSLTKEDITGEAEIPGNEISFYKIKDVNDVDEDGLISHADDNLLLLDQWVSGSGAHVVKGLELSNDEWPRLNNQEVRKNIYVFRETNPAAGYVSAPDIEVMVYQICDETGSWFDASGNLYGYKVLTAHVAADQDYKNGSLLIPNAHADDWIAEGKAESDWDYSTVLKGETAAKWLLVNKNLVLFVKDGITQRTLDKVLKESDFADLTFDTVYFEFAGTKLNVSGFFPDKQVNTRPADSKITYTKTWVSLEDIALHMYDDTTKVKINKYDITTGEEVVGAHLRVVDKETGTVIEEWTTGDDGYDENGKALPHYIEEKLDVNHPYILEETLAPTQNGYVTSNSVEFTLNDSGEIQKVDMMDDYTKLEISKADIVTGEEIAGAKLQIWSLDAAGNKAAKVAEWISGSDGYDADGKLIRHRIDYLPTGKYVLVEESAPSGYLVAEDVAFEIKDTGLIQKVQMLDATTSLKIYKYKTGTTQFVSGAVIDVYEIPAEYINYLTPDTRFEAEGSMVDAAADPDYTVNDTEIGETDLGAYLTGMKAASVEHRKDYRGHLTFEYSAVKADLVNAGYTMSQALPEGISLDTTMGTDYEAFDGTTKAFTYRFDRSASGDRITVTFEQSYVDDNDSFNFTVSADAVLKNVTALANGNIRMKVTDGYTLEIAKDNITEVGSSVDAPATTIRLTDADRRATVKTNGGPMTISGLTPGWYVAMERTAPSGYILDTTPQVFHLLAATGEQALYFYNAPKPNHHGGGGHKGSSPETPPTPVTPGEPLIGKLTLKINGGYMWNNVKTEDNGEDGSSIIFEVEHTKTFPYIYVVVGLLAVAAILGGAGIVLFVRRRRYDY